MSPPSSVDPTYRRLEAELAALRTAGGDDARDDALCEEMSDLWWQLSHEERAAAHARARHQSEGLAPWPLKPEPPQVQRLAHGRLVFHLEFLQPAVWELSGLAWGRVSATCTGEAIWSAEGPWPLVDLLQHLAELWLPLHHELAPPEGVLWRTREPGPRGDRSGEGQRFVPVGVRSDAAADKAWEFLHRHDLGRGLHGHRLPSLWLFRKPYTETCKLVGEEPPEHLLPWRDVSAALIDLGDAIAQRLTASIAPRAATARQAWAARGAKSLEWLRWATLLPVDALSGLVDPTQGANAIDFGEPEQEEPVAAAARLSAPFPVPERLRLVRALARHQQGAAPGAAPMLAALRRERPPEPLPLRQPYASAYALAAWVRERFGLAEDRVDIEALLQDLGVCVVELDPTLPTLDAVATLSRTGAACIFVNPTGLHIANNPGGRRATLAHELCHLLVDLGGALPLAEVLGGTASPPHEQRARAFAAELLLPREIAAAELRKRLDAEGSPDLWATLRHLTARYEVSTQLAALQIENSDARPLITEPASVAFLRKMKTQAT